VTRRELLASAALSTAAIAAGCAPAKQSPHVEAAVPSGRADGVLTGGARKIQIDGKYEVWVKQVGRGAIPMLTLHGGPGFPHFYFECFEDFIPRDRVRFWYYDQLGCGFSDRPDDASLWTVERYRGEVEQVRAALGLEHFVLYGQSWGAMLAIEYALAHPERLSGLVLSNMTASIPSYVKHVTELRDSLPPDTVAAMKAFEARGEYEAPEYQDILMKQLYPKHLCRLDPWPEPAVRSFTNMNPQIYNTMQGPSEFVVNGNFASWDRWADLPRISTPTLLLVGRHDTMSVEDIQKMGALLPGSRVVVCENGSHLSLYDDQKAYFDALVPFLVARGV
jgi:proline iminopeptidase